MAPILWTVYLVIVGAVTVNCRRLHQQTTQNTIIHEVTEDMEAVDDLYEDDDIMLTDEEWDAKQAQWHYQVWHAWQERKAIKETTKRWTEGPVQPDGNRYPTVPYAFMSDEPSICKKYDIAIYCNLRYVQRYCKVSCPDGIGHHEAFPDYLKPEINRVFQHWQNHTCIKFEDITSYPESSEKRQKPHLLLDGYKGKCSSYKGMENYYGFPGQHIHLVCPNKTFGTRVHEVGHAIGFHHEHTRTVRDKHIKVFPDNVIREAFRKGFNLDPDDEYNMSIPYDYSSVMHYGPYQGSVGNKVVLVPNNPVDMQLLLQRDGLSFRDMHLANKMYNCIEKWESICLGYKPTSCGEGYIGPGKYCTCVCPPHKTGLMCEKDKPGYNGDYYYEKRTHDLNEVVTSPKKLIAKVPTNVNPLLDFIFVKSIDPPVCKTAKVTFTSSNLPPKNCTKTFLHVVTDLNDLEGEPLCHDDLVKGHIIKSDKIIIINTIFDSDPDDIKDTNDIKTTNLWEAEVTFDDIAGCIDPSKPGCPNGLFRVGNQCFYFLNDTLRTWLDGKKKCEEEGYSLAEPQDLLAVSSYIVDTYDPPQPTWLGAQGDGSSMVWLRSGEAIWNQHPAWYPGDPGSKVTQNYNLLLGTMRFFLRYYTKTPLMSWTGNFKTYTLCELV